MANNKIMFPPEVEVWYILPAIRKEIALGLIKKGLSQKQIATILGVTEASISHYKKNKRASENILTAEAKLLTAEATNSITKDPRSYYKVTTRLLDQIRKSGLLCDLYEEKTHLEEEHRACTDCKLQEKKLCFEES